MKLRSKLVRAAAIVFSLLLAVFGVWFSQKRAPSQQTMMPSSKLKIFRSNTVVPPAAP